MKKPPHRPYRPLHDRIMDYISPEPMSGCWLWLASVDTDGYGQIGDESRPIDGKRYRGMVKAHRTTYEMFIGPIPDGLVIDHLCRVRCCVNPRHMEPVTDKENHRRGDFSWAQWRIATSCIHGHEFTPSNTYHSTYKGKSNGRQCLTCSRIRKAKKRLEEASHRPKTFE